MVGTFFDSEHLKNLEREGYSAHPETYDRLLMPLTSAFTDALLNMAPIKNGECVLDVACGTGPSTIEAASLVGESGRVIGIDIAPGMLRFAREKAEGAGLRNVEFHQMDAENLEFRDSTFDVVICQFGLIHFPNRLGALAEMRRVLRPGGRVVLSVWSHPERVRILSLFGEIVARHVPKLISPNIPTYYDLGAEGVLEAAFEKAGLRNPRTKKVALDYFLDTPADYWDWNYREWEVTLVAKLRQRKY